jgi:hypothetical protein
MILLRPEKIIMNTIQLLKENIFTRAQVFIEDMNHFAPFGVKLTNQKAKDVIVYDDSKDSMNGLELVEILKNNFSLEIKSATVESAAIAYDIVASFKNDNDVFEKRDALCLIISTDGIYWTEEYFPYMLIGGKCVWK